VVVWYSANSYFCNLDNFKLKITPHNCSYFFQVLCSSCQVISRVLERETCVICRAHTSAIFKSNMYMGPEERLISENHVIIVRSPSELLNY